MVGLLCSSRLLFSLYSYCICQIDISNLHGQLFYVSQDYPISWFYFHISHIYILYLHVKFVSVLQDYCSLCIIIAFVTMILATFVGSSFVLLQIICFGKFLITFVTYISPTFMVSLYMWFKIIVFSGFLSHLSYWYWQFSGARFCISRLYVIVQSGLLLVSS